MVRVAETVVVEVLVVVVVVINIAAAAEIQVFLSDKNMETYQR